MRRSKAPSAKRLCNANHSVEEDRCADPESEQYAWGSSNRNIKYEENKRIFNVVWRDVSTKKHKTWKGDGTLEVNNVLLRAILKDETGKYIGCSTKINRSDLVPDFQMVIAGKEIEIQNEITSKEQLLELSKIQAENRYWVDEEWNLKDKADKENKPKGGFKFKPILVLNPPKAEFENQCLNSNWRNDEIQNFQTNISKNASNLCSLNVTRKVHTSWNPRDFRKYICFIRPSELQQFLFQKALEYSISIESGLDLDKNQTGDIKTVLKFICNHPSLINHKTSTNKLMNHLIPFLPDWSEMGPFDSGKLEFVQYFLSNLSKNRETCIIFAKNLVVLNMLQGLCDFMNIKCFRLNTNLLGDIERQMINFVSTETRSVKVLLLNSMEILSNVNFSIYCKKLIVFEEVSENINICELENVRDMMIYNLVTAFSIEELLLFDKYNNDSMDNLLDELVNITNAENTSCYLHIKIKCNCFKSFNEINSNHAFVKNWQHFKNPFDVEVLRISSMENSSENIVSIFCKK